MAKYLYNGVELPALPEWDKETYPYVYIIEHISDDPSLYQNWYNLHVSSAQGVEKEHSALWPSVIYLGTDVGYTYEIVDGAWVLTAGSSEPVLDQIILVNNTGTDAQLIWASHDVYSDDGTLFFAGSDPVPVSTIDPKSLMMSWLVGKKIAGMRGKVQPDSGETEQPVAYLYNGVQLPPLPEWDKTVYPYAVIMDLKSATNATSDFIVWFFDNPIVFRGSYLSYANGINDGYAQNHIYNNGDSGWVLNKEKTDFWDDLSLSGDLVWTNTDILSEADGTVYMAASEPVPVYE